MGEGNVYNLATDEKIGTGVDPSLQRSSVSVPLEQRIADLNASIPQDLPSIGGRNYRVLLSSSWIHVLISSTVLMKFTTQK